MHSNIGYSQHSKYGKQSGYNYQHSSKCGYETNMDEIIYISLHPQWPCQQEMTIYDVANEICVCFVLNKDETDLEIISTKEFE